MAEDDARARGADPESGVLTMQKSGRYVRAGDTEYPLASPGGNWALWSPTPVEGFRKIGNGWVRNIAPDEQLECFRVAHRGTYRGIPVTVEPGGGALVRLDTRDPRAAEQGFERFGFERPELQSWLKFVSADDRDLVFTTTRTPEPMPWAASTRDAVAQRPVPRPSDAEPSAWGAFTLRLITALRGVTDGVFLIVSVDGDPLRYVQFAGDPGTLHAEAPARDLVADADESVLRAAGWNEPGAAQPNWTSELPLPAYASDFRELAERCVAALRDAYGATSPDTLVHRAWRDPEQTSLEFPGLGPAQV
ncbi:TY-Chap domain-containing protein [Microbacterium oxydans]|uniref:TY-Chap domain-containing protein n=1 Tax=Microbacterium oxydans TaxID=82380 RepID=UPI000B87C544|nr:hypothetical protein [Microbacterium oxydans]